MNRAPRELIDDLRAALIAERQARKAAREATHRGGRFAAEAREQFAWIKRPGSAGGGAEASA